MRLWTAVWVVCRSPLASPTSIWWPTAASERSPPHLTPRAPLETWRLASRPSTLHTGNVFQHYLCFSICFSSEGFQCYPKFTRILYVCLWLIAKISMKYYKFTSRNESSVRHAYTVVIKKSRQFSMLIAPPPLQCCGSLWSLESPLTEILCSDDAVAELVCFLPVLREHTTDTVSTVDRSAEVKRLPLSYCYLQDLYALA